MARPAGALAVVALLGCSAPAEDAARFTARDSAGIRVVESAAPVWGEGEAWRVDPAPDLDLSGAGGGDLERPSAPRLLVDGRLLLYDGGSCTVRTYDTAGGLQRSFGGCGEGPGELRAFAGVWPGAGDTVIVVDQLPRRLTLFDGGGAVVRTTRLPTSPALPFVTAVDPVGEGLFLLRGPRDPGVPAGPGTARAETVAEVAAPGDSVPVFSATFPGPLWVYTEREGGLGRGILPFSSAAAFAVGRAEILVGIPDRYEIRVLGTDGTLRRILRRAFEPLPVEDADIDHLMRRRLAEVEDEAAQRLVRRAFADLDHADVMPAFGVPVWTSGREEGGPDLLVDDAGHLWVFEHYRPGAYANRFSVFAPSGEWLGRVELPSGLRPTQVGRDFVLGTWEDEVGFVHVRRHALVKPGS